jgi:hypothetical protein
MVFNVANTMVYDNTYSLKRDLNIDSEMKFVF